MALGRSTLLGDALTLRAHAVEPGQPMLGLPRLGLELLVVLEVGLERGGVHGPRVQQVIEDEVAHLPIGLKSRALTRSRWKASGSAPRRCRISSRYVPASGNRRA